jgi:ribosomal protein S18 acetylase RimI-like enzyme
VDTGLLRRALEVNFENLALGHDTFRADGATFVVNTSLPAIYDANFVFSVTASNVAQIERLLDRAAREYAHAAKLTFRVDPFTPALFEARLVLEEYQRYEGLVLVLDGPLRGEAPTIDIRPISDDIDWIAYSELKCLDWVDHAKVTDDSQNLSIPFGFVAANRLKCPPVQYVLAYENRQAIGYCNAWRGIAGVGQVEDLFVHPAHRRRGVGSALLHHCVAIAKSEGAEYVVIVVDPSNPAKKLYSTMGWRPAAMCRQYGKPMKAR